MQNASDSAKNPDTDSSATSGDVKNVTFTSSSQDPDKPKLQRTPTPYNHDQSDASKPPGGGEEPRVPPEGKEAPGSGGAPGGANEDSEWSNTEGIKSRPVMKSKSRRMRREFSMSRDDSDEDEPVAKQAD